MPNEYLFKLRKLFFIRILMSLKRKPRESPIPKKNIFPLLFNVHLRKNAGMNIESSIRNEVRLCMLKQIICDEGIFIPA